MLTFGVYIQEVDVLLKKLKMVFWSDIGGQDWTWFKRTVNHHLEHVGHIVLNAVSSEVGAFLVILHLHVTAGHLNHTVVDSLVGVLQGLKIGVLKGEKGAWCFEGLVTSSNINEHTY